MATTAYQQVYNSVTSTDMKLKVDVIVAEGHPPNILKVVQHFAMLCKTFAHKVVGDVDSFRHVIFIVYTYYP